MRKINILLYNLCIVLPCPALPCPALPCPALPCPALPCPALPCPALPCPALPCLPCPSADMASRLDLCNSLYLGIGDQGSLSLWPSGIGSRLGRNRLWVRFLAVSDIYPMFIEPTITWVPSGFSGYIWLDTKIVLKKRVYWTVWTSSDCGGQSSEIRPYLPLVLHVLAASGVFKGTTGLCPFGQKNQFSTKEKIGNMACPLYLFI